MTEPLTLHSALFDMRPTEKPAAAAEIAAVADPWANISQNLWQPPASTELSFMSGRGAVQSQGEIDTIKDQITKGATDPEQAFLTATKNNRVVGFGDVHGPLGPHMALLAEEMPKLKAAGISHLAVEIPATFQPQIDRWNATDQTFLHDRLKDKGSLLEVIEAAKKAGVKVVGVDEFYSAYGEKLASRDRTMAKNIENILQDPKAKVAYFVGAEHLQNGFRLDSYGPSAVDLLRHKKIAVETFLAQITSSEDALMPIARDLSNPVSVNKNDVPSIKGIKNSAGTTYDKWDNVVFYPTHYKMDAVETELQKVGVDPKSRLVDALAGNPVLIVGEMTRAESEQDVSPHRRFLATVMPDLRQAGLTDLAVDMAPGYQNALDDFTRTGQFSGPLPDSYDHGDFRDVLQAARSAGVRLHAVGVKNELLTPPEEIIDRLAGAAADIAKDAPGNKVLLWCREEKAANFRDPQGADIGVSGALKNRGIGSTTFAAYTQDFTVPSLGLVTGVTPRPLAFDPAQTTLLKDVPNTLDVPMEMFDNVIVYPSP